MERRCPVSQSCLARELPADLDVTDVTDVTDVGVDASLIGGRIDRPALGRGVPDSARTGRSRALDAHAERQTGDGVVAESGEPGFDSTSLASLLTTTNQSAGPLY